MLIVLYVVNVAVQPEFAHQEGWAQSMAVLAPTALTAMAMTLPVLSGNGGIDLSVGPLAGFMTVFISAVRSPPVPPRPNSSYRSSSDSGWLPVPSMGS